MPIEIDIIGQAEGRKAFQPLPSEVVVGKKRLAISEKPAGKLETRKASLVPKAGFVEPKTFKKLMNENQKWRKAAWDMQTIAKYHGEGGPAKMANKVEAGNRILYVSPGFAYKWHTFLRDKSFEALKLLVKATREKDAIERKKSLQQAIRRMAFLRIKFGASPDTVSLKIVDDIGDAGMFTTQDQTTLYQGIDDFEGLGEISKFYGTETGREWYLARDPREPTYHMGSGGTVNYGLRVRGGGGSIYNTSGADVPTLTTPNQAPEMLPLAPQQRKERMLMPERGAPLRYIVEDLGEDGQTLKDLGFWEGALDVGYAVEEDGLYMPENQRIDFRVIKATDFASLPSDGAILGAAEEYETVPAVDVMGDLGFDSMLDEIFALDVPAKRPKKKTSFAAKAIALAKKKAQEFAAKKKAQELAKKAKAQAKAGAKAPKPAKPVPLIPWITKYAVIPKIEKLLNEKDLTSQPRSAASTVVWLKILKAGKIPSNRQQKEAQNALKFLRSLPNKGIKVSVPKVIESKKTQNAKKVAASAGKGLKEGRLEAAKAAQGLAKLANEAKKKSMLEKAKAQKNKQEAAKWKQKGVLALAKHHEEEANKAELMSEAAENTAFDLANEAKETALFATDAPLELATSLFNNIIPEAKEAAVTTEILGQEIDKQQLILLGGAALIGVIALGGFAAKKRRSK